MRTLHDSAVRNASGKTLLQAEPITPAEQLSSLTTLASYAKQVRLRRFAALQPCMCYMPYRSGNSFAISLSRMCKQAYIMLTLTCFVQVLLTADPKQKAALTHLAWQRFKAGAMSVGKAEPPARPARPLRPQAWHAWQQCLPYPAHPCIPTHHHSPA